MLNSVARTIWKKYIFFENKRIDRYILVLPRNVFELSAVERCLLQASRILVTKLSSRSTQFVSSSLIFFFFSKFLLRQKQDIFFLNLINKWKNKKQLCFLYLFIILWQLANKNLYTYWIHISLPFESSDFGEDILISDLNCLAFLILLVTTNKTKASSSHPQITKYLLSLNPKPSQ